MKTSDLVLRTIVTILTAVVCIRLFYYDIIYDITGIESQSNRVLAGYVLVHSVYFFIKYIKEFRAQKKVID